MWKNGRPESKINQQTKYQNSWQNYRQNISSKLLHTPVKAGNWAPVLAKHLVWKPLDKFRIAKALKRNHHLMPATEDPDGPWIYSGQKRWLYGMLRPYGAVQEWNSSLSVDKQKPGRILHLISALYPKVINFSACQMDPTKPGAK